MLSEQTKEIKDLKQLVKSLAKNLSTAKNQLLILKANQAGSPKEHDNATELLQVISLRLTQTWKVTNSATPAVAANTTEPNSLSVQADQKYSAALAV